MRKPLALVIEDDPNIAQLFATVLGKAGYENEVHRSGLTALLRLPHAKPDLIVLDLKLPRVKGTEILRLIREDSRFGSTPVFVVSAHWEETESKEVKENADLVLLKPVSVSQLFDFAIRFRPRASEMTATQSPIAPLVVRYAN